MIVSRYRIEVVEPLAGGVIGLDEKLGVRPEGVNWTQTVSPVLKHHMAERVTAELKLFIEVTVMVVLASEVPEILGDLREVSAGEIEKSGAVVTVTVVVASAGLATSLSALTLGV